jgi:selenide,water dikinase
VSDDIALVSTTDFFPPLVDDPSDFGAIAAANACSDVYAMGGKVLMAVNVAAFPENFPREAIVAIFAAASDVMAQAGGSVAGGHTIRNPEPIFGLAVQGIVHPDRVFTKGGAREGDVLLLSKPLGTGIALAGGSDADKATAIAGMRQLNRDASERLQARDLRLLVTAGKWPSDLDARLKSTPRSCPYTQVYLRPRSAAFELGEMRVIALRSELA